MNLALISHCNFYGNTGIHLFSIATELTRLGNDCCIVVPDAPETISDVGVPSFKVTDFETALNEGISFNDGRGPSFIHAWTPREHVRKMTEQLLARYECPYIVHMEDNERQIVADELNELSYRELEQLPADLIDSIIGRYRTHPRHSVSFFQNAAGYTCLVDRLLEFKPRHMPSLIFPMGFEPAFANISINVEAVRKEYGFESDDIIVLYSGNVHASTVKDIKTLYIAIRLLNASGLKVKLLRTGHNYAEDWNPDEAQTKNVVDLGFVTRGEIPRLVGISDILIQPGRSDDFNDYRFPSKLPEYFASGKPVILPDTNIGRRLEHEVHALKISTGTLKELMDAIKRLIEDKELGERIGRKGRDFALANLAWPKSAAALDRFYHELASQLAVSTHKSGSYTADARPRHESAFPVKLIAFYLPQFHPIPENDKWWGKGFTEWANVTRAKPNLKAHRQPRLPTDLGFYDLRVADVLNQQATLARDAGISAFCFYYYWFGGRRLLEKPLDNWLGADGPDFPFCICWANEGWSRRWDGSEHDVLIAQDYGENYAERFFLDILPILKDPRYLRVDNAPVLSVYRVSDLPDPIAAVQTWRRMAVEAGIGRIHLCAIQSFGLGDPRPFGFDAAVEFSPPHVDRMLVGVNDFSGANANFTGYIEDYISVAMRSINHPAVDYVRYRGLFARWDNTPRRGERGHIFINDSPKAYAQWLRHLVHEALYRRKQQEPLIFINAWNEWGEGAYLEPDDMYSSGLLDITRVALIEGIKNFFGRKTAEQERDFTERVSLLPDAIKRDLM